MTERMGGVICDITISADGYSAGLKTEERPFGDGGDGWGDKLHAWMFETPEENRAEVDQWAAAKAFIMGRNMFGPVRGEWDRQWNGWWGEDPPFHASVFVLTRHAREPQPMDGGTTYYFVTDGIESALAQARAAAGDGDVVIAGGATTINQYVSAGLIDELWLHIVPLTKSTSGLRARHRGGGGSGRCCRRHALRGLGVRVSWRHADIGAPPKTHDFWHFGGGYARRWRSPR